MTRKTLIAIAALAACPLLHATLQEEADSLNIPDKLDMFAKQLEIPKLDGTDVRILGTDYEEIIGRDGKVHSRDAKVRVNFELKRGEEKAISRDYVVQVQAPQPKGGNANAPQTIPQVLDWGCLGGNKKVDLAKLPELTLCLPAEMKAVQKDLLKELGEAVGKPCTTAAAGKAAVCLKLRKKEDADRYPLGKEGYVLDINPGASNAVTIEAETATGLYWGTRTLMQMLRRGTELTAGYVTDIPRYPVRGFVFDVGRLPVPFSYLKEVVNTMAWYKMNDLHIHLNDNYIFLEEYAKAGKNPFKEAYSGFRIESVIKGPEGNPLTSEDVSYTKKQFRELIDYAKARGVNIVPEFDAPAHSLSFTRVRPELQLVNDKVPRSCEELDAAKPESAAFIAELWDEYLKPDKKLGRPVFEGCTVHIGADEFKGNNEDYRKFTDTVLGHIQQRGYTPRLWGSLTMKKGKTPVRAKGVQMNIWSKDWNLPWQAINEGFDIINTMDSQLYIVPFANYYRMDRNLKGLYENFVPNQIGPKGGRLAVRLPAGHPQLLGAAFAVWNDMIDLKYQGYGSHDLRKMIQDTICAASQKFWGPEELPRSFDEHTALAGEIGNAPRGLGRKLPKAGHFKMGGNKGKIDKDLDLSSLGANAIPPEYSLKLTLKQEKATPGKEQVLLEGPSGKLFAAMKDGSMGFRRDDGVEFSFGYTLPEGKEVELEIVGKEGSTALLVDGQPAGTLTLTSFHNRTKDLISTFVLPFKKLGSSFRGTITALNLEYKEPQK